MTTSGSVNFTQTRNELIYDAFQLIGVYGIGRTISSEDMTYAASALNKMIKSWGTRGLHLWTKEECTLFLTKNEGTYNLGGTANACLSSDAVITQLNGSLASSATALTVDSTTSMTVGDYIGVVMTNNDVHYTTIATIPTSTTLTLTLGVTSVASDNALVYTFTNKITKPLRVLSCRRAQGLDSGNTTTLSEIIMAQVSYEDYFALPSKTISGLPNQFHYNPQRDNGNIYLWQRPNDGNYRVNFTAERIIEDLDTAADTFDFPGEWLEPLTWQLALRLAPAFGKDKRMQGSIYPVATAMFENLLDWDAETSSLQMQPDIENG